MSSSATPAELTRTSAALPPSPASAAAYAECIDLSCYAKSNEKPKHFG